LRDVFIEFGDIAASVSVLIPPPRGGGFRVPLGYRPGSSRRKLGISGRTLSDVLMSLILGGANPSGYTGNKFGVRWERLVCLFSLGHHHHAAWPTIHDPAPRNMTCPSICTCSIEWNMLSLFVSTMRHRPASRVLLPSNPPINPCP
jgi:hypothetical protein